MSSLDLIEKQMFGTEDVPFSGEYGFANKINSIPITVSSNNFDLCGEWDMVMDGTSEERLGRDNWNNSVNCNVPCSVHKALLDNGIIPNPYIGLNDKIARSYSYKEWWFKKKFTYDFSFSKPELVFEGVCYSAEFYLNGIKLGTHKGMFTKAVFDVSDVIKKENELVVKIENAPALPKKYSEDADYDEGWNFGTVINCVYGWHYACIPSRGIWKPVYLREKDNLEREEPFITTIDTKSALMDFSMKFGKESTGKIIVSFNPDNFEGDNQSFSYDYSVHESGKVHFRFNIENAKLWWPNNYGDQPLYNVKVECCPNEGQKSTYKYLIGIRTIEMIADGSGESEGEYNWQMVINGRNIFFKGSNWCTIDALLDFKEKTYDRMLFYAKDQNVNLLRSWGCGMPESNYFYEQCSRLGLMVCQEWPTSWASEKVQPYDELRDTTYENTLRIRNNPSLVMYGGGNENSDPHGDIINEMIRLSCYLDGTRPFHRTSPYGSKVIHSYTTYWYLNGIDASLELDSVVLNEFGMASSPNVDSVLRYIPKEEFGLWELRGKHNSFVHHLPRFNQYVEWPYGDNDIDHITKYLDNFYGEENLEEFVTGTQLAQCLIYRHPIDNYRTNYPNSTGISCYKLNDVYPAASWATIDFYGACKMSHYAVKDAYRPLHACLKVRSIDVDNSTILPVYILNDNNEKVTSVVLKVYNDKLENVYSQVFEVGGEKCEVQKLGDLSFENIPLSFPMIITLAVMDNGNKVTSTFYIFNFKDKKHCLFNLPKTKLEYFKCDGGIVVKNTGNNLAVGVLVDKPGYNDEFYIENGNFYLESGESVVLKSNDSDNLRVRAWNYNWNEYYKSLNWHK